MCVCVCVCSSNSSSSSSYNRIGEFKLLNISVKNIKKFQLVESQSS